MYAKMWLAICTIIVADVNGYTSNDFVTSITFERKKGKKKKEIVIRIEIEKKKIFKIKRSKKFVLFDR